METVKIHFTLQGQEENRLLLLQDHPAQEVEAFSSKKLNQKYKYRMRFKHLNYFLSRDMQLKIMKYTNKHAIDYWKLEKIKVEKFRSN